MLKPETLSNYEEARDCPDKSVLCHAPFANIYFNQMGQGTACCYNNKQVLGTYPGDSVEDMWFGERATELREALKRGDLSLGCQVCAHQLNSGNVTGHITTFDRYASQDGSRSNPTRPGPPLGMEFSLSNTCSLECAMCNGALSSSIRKREGLPPIPNPYDDAFVAQLEPFVPTLKVAKFYGGEPFLIEIYHRIWELFERVNPEIDIEITSSAATISPRTKARLEALRCRVIVSLDSLTKEIYEGIRKNASFEQVMENVDYLLDYAANGGGALSLTVCPMQQNWHEMPDIVRFANEKNVAVWFNTVYEPLDCSLRTLGQDALDPILAAWRGATLPKTSQLETENLRRFEGVISQVARWREERVEADASSTLISGAAFAEGEDPQTDLIAFLTRLIGEYGEMRREGLGPKSFDAASAAIRHQVEVSMGSYLEVLDAPTFYRCFLDTLGRCYPGANGFSETEATSFRQKLYAIAEMLAKTPGSEAFAPQLIRQDIRLVAEWIRRSEVSEMAQVMQMRAQALGGGGPGSGPAG